jgi:hypothetical protein
MSLNNTVQEIYSVFETSLPEEIRMFVTIFFLSILISVYAIFIWKFSKFTAKKDIIELNLRKYNKAEHPVISFLFGVILYFIEYILILPFLIIFWYVVFSIFLFVLAESMSTGQVLLMSMVVISSIRMLAYYKEEVSKEVAKLVPLTLLGVGITKANFFDLSVLTSQISEIPSFLYQIIFYFLLVFVLEILLRFFDLIFVESKRLKV